MVARSAFKIVGDDALLGATDVDQARIHFAMLLHECLEVAFLQNRRSVEDIEKFAHIARIVILAKRGNLLLRKRRIVVVLAPPGIGNVRDVLLVFTERGNTKLHDIEPLEEVGAELRKLYSWNNEDKYSETK